MASTSQSHPAFPTRPYNSTYQQPTTKLPDRSGPLAFGASSHTHSAREAARQERERSAAAQAAAQQVAAGSNTIGTMAQLSEEQRDEINEAFSLFDLDRDNLIDYHEFKVALKALGFDLPKPDLLSLITQHGIPPPPRNPQGGGAQSLPLNEPIPPSRLRLTLTSFQTIASTLISQRDPREEILRAFALFDTEGKGMITLEDLRRVARELNEGLEEEELVAMIEEFDIEGKGGVGREEFVAICMG